MIILNLRLNLMLTFILSPRSLNRGYNLAQNPTKQLSEMHREPTDDTARGGDISNVRRADRHSTHSGHPRTKQRPQAAVNSTE